MSGRDLRAFLSEHRNGTFNFFKNSGLSEKYLVGGASFGGRGLKVVDYSQLLSQVEGHRTTGQIQCKKVKGLSKKGEESKEAGLLSLHQEVWMQKWKHLLKERQKIERDIEEWRVAVLLAGSAKWLGEVMEYEANLNQERKEFEQDALRPLQLLQVGLKSWMKVSGCPEADQSQVTHWRDLHKELDSVKEQHKVIQCVLESESLSLSEDVNHFFQQTMISSNGGERLSAPLPVMECSNLKLKNSLMEEFQELDKHYQSVLKQLQEKYSAVLSSRCGGWPVHDSEKFKFIIEQYPPSTRMRRRVYLDRLAREFPQYSREQLLEQETWLQSNCHYLQQCEACLRDWQTQRRALEVKVKGVLEEYAQEVALKKVDQKAREEQIALCKRLSNKVTKWREEKQVEAALKAEEFAAIQQQAAAEKAKEEERRKKRVEKKKMKLHTYHERQEEEAAREEVWLQQLRTETEALRKEMAWRGKVRVQHRREKLMNKISQQKKHKEEEEEKEREKERKLELLRQQVKIHVASDPERIHQQTQSVRARMTSDLELPAQHPLFSLHSYTAHQVISDPRVRLEEALHKAGLLTSKYAQQVLASVQPPSNPRPDQTSSVFRDT